VSNSSQSTTTDRGTFSALRSSNFRLYFAGQLISTAGTWMQNIAQAYLVFAITQNPLWSGVVACAAGLPLILLAPVAGVIVERYPRRDLMIVTQTVQMILAFILTVLMIANIVQVWQIIVLAFILGITNAFDFPARQTFIVEMVGREDLQSGIQLNSLLNSSSRLLGPAAAGVALVAVGAAWCFFLNGLSFIAVIFSLVLMKVPFAIHRRSSSAPMRQLREGLAYSQGDSLIAPLLLMTACVGLFTLPINQLFAAFAAQALNSPTDGYSAIAVGNGVGAVLAGGLVGWMAARFGRGRVIGVMVVLASISNILLALQRTVVPATILSALAGLFTVSEVVSLNTLIQAAVPDELRGRVMSLYSLAFFGLSPFGALVLGIVASQIGTANAVLISAILGGVIAGGLLVRWPNVLQGQTAEALALAQEAIGD